MKPTAVLMLLGAFGMGLAGCTGTLSSASSPRDPFVTYLEQFGAATASSTNTTTSSGSGATTLNSALFRRNLTVSLVNSNPERSLETLFLAWVELGSVRSGEQQDELLRAGYVQLSRTLEIGVTYSLPPGTFIFNGQRTADPSRIRLVKAGATAGGVDNVQYELPTPDVILVYSAPPESCDSVAFTYDDNGLIDVGPSTGRGGYKTLAQIDVYQCDPLQPGLFYQAQGGARQPNQYLEGSPITFTFLQNAVNGAFATVQIG